MADNIICIHKLGVLLSYNYVSVGSIAVELILTFASMCQFVCCVCQVIRSSYHILGCLVFRGLSDFLCVFFCVLCHVF